MLVSYSLKQEYHVNGDIDESEGMKQVMEKGSVSEVIADEEEEDQSTPDEALNLEPPEKESKTEFAESPSTIDKSSEFTLETETTTDLMYQKSETTEQVKFEGQIVEEPLSSKDSEIRSLIFEKDTVEASKEYKNTAGADDIIQDDIPKEKVEKKIRMIC